MKNLKIPWLSSGVLIFANLVQLLGVFLFHWDFFCLSFAYWPEIFIILFFTYLKVQKIKKHGGSTDGVKEGFEVMGIAIIASMPWSWVIFSYLIFELKFPAYKVLCSFLILFMSHWVSFIVNFLGDKEFVVLPVQQIMKNVIKRCVTVVSIIILGVIFHIGFAYDFYHPPKIVLVCIIFIKIILDLLFHIAEHKKSIDSLRVIS